MPLMWRASKVMTSPSNTPEQHQFPPWPIPGGHHIYLVGTLTMTHIKSIDKVKKRPLPL